MTQEEKQLLLVDLCGRLLYKVKVTVPIPTWINSIEPSKEPIELIGINIVDNTCVVGNSLSQISGIKIFNRRGELLCKPHLRPMSSMTEKEKDFYDSMFIEVEGNYFGMFPAAIIDWLNTHHFDYRGLIPMGLAIEATEGMYNTKTE